MVRLILVKE